MTAIEISTRRTETVDRLYALVLIATLAVLPLGLILYLDRFQAPALHRSG